MSSAIPINPLRIQATVMDKLSDAISHNVKALVKMEDGTAVANAAWHARNLLELSIWIPYCIKSQENAVRFAVDAIRDFDDIIKLLPQEQIDANPEANENIRKFQSARAELAEDLTSEDFSKRFTSVRAAAESIGKLVDYELNMKFLSKWAHPTAMEVMLSGELSADAVNALRIILTKSAFEMAEEAIKMAKAFIEETKRGFFLPSMTSYKGTK